MTDLEGIIDEAHLLKPGDVVAVSFRQQHEPEVYERIRMELAKAESKVGVRFILFEDADFDVFRPVKEDE